MLNLTLRHTNAVHRYPAQQKDIQPDVEDPHEVEIRVLPADTVVDPRAVTFKAVHALVAHVTVLRSFGLDYFAVGTQLLAWHVLHECFHLELGSSRRLDVARVAAN